MPVWAKRATKLGGICCFLAAIRMMIGMITSLYQADKPLANAIAWTIGASVVPAVMAASGMRLWQSKGAYAGIAASLFMMAEVAMAVLWSEAAVEMILLLGMLIGTAGAWLVLGVQTGNTAGDGPS